MKKVGLFLGVILPLLLLVFADFGGSVQANRMAAVALMMSVFWITEAIPLAATALIPLVLFPILGIASSKSTASQYMNSTVFLLIGGFMIAIAMQQWNLHKRIALNILSVFGGQPSLLVLGFLVATAGLSMWISNTATTLMMLPIALAIISRYEVFLSVTQVHRFTLGLLLTIAYSASIGGMMTLVGTAPNLVFARFYESEIGVSVGFSQWMLIAVPIGIGLLVTLFFFIYLLFIRGLPKTTSFNLVIKEEKSRLGNISSAEKRVCCVFVVTALLWVTRKGVKLGDIILNGWSEYYEYGHYIDDGSVAITMAVLLFFIPSRQEQGMRRTLLDKHVFVELPWAIVLLFGGGFALAYGFTESGLSVYLAEQLQGLKTVPLSLLIVSVSAGMSLLTELTSNTATTQLVMPILLSTANVIDVSPAWLMLPAVFSASCAFMFPVATPPNAIIFGSGKIKVLEMVRAGFILNLFSIAIVSGFCFWLIPLFIGGD